MSQYPQKGLRPARCLTCNKLFMPRVNASKIIKNHNCRECRKRITIENDFKSVVYR